MHFEAEPSLPIGESGYEDNESPTDGRVFARDAFILYADADAPFVRGYLLPELGLAPGRVLLSGELELAEIVVEEIERGVRTSRFTVVVLSPAYIADRWFVFGDQLAAHARFGEPGGHRLLPLLRADCDLPDHIRMLVGLDFRDSRPEVWAAQAARLRSFLQRPQRVESDLACPYPGLQPFTELDAQRFFGRDAELDDLVGRLRRGEREVYVIGASGSGKSSLIAAGLVPRLAGDASRSTGGISASCRHCPT